VGPILGAGDSRPYTGRDPLAPTQAYTDVRATSWFYVAENVNPAFVGQLREQYGAVDPNCETTVPGTPDAFFYNEQIATLARAFTEFFLPQLNDPTDTQGRAQCNPDNYYVTSGFIDPTARWRVWTMPAGGVPAGMPPSPPDLTTDFGTAPGSPRRASFSYDPDNGTQLFTGADSNGARLYGGPVPAADDACTVARQTLLQGAGDASVVTDTNGYPVEVRPYTDPFARSIPTRRGPTR
jgi:hypothetical protein